MPVPVVPRHGGDFSGCCDRNWPPPARRDSLKAMTPADRALALPLTLPRPGGYARGAATAEAIVKAALKVLIEEGAAQFTVRRIAAECGMKVGNVSYHFPRKDMLVQVMLADMLESYDKVLDSQVRQPGLSARKGCAASLRCAWKTLPASAPPACSLNCGPWPTTTPWWQSASPSFTPASMA
ncbi:TetR/AcrR family transcriptional regulator [Novosphingobium pokkalii]|uniref:TetR/AcrR family transcriptional regulator n=1 Tax=Novosphingobium pokkalii TaxID=1770194 RepID=UPI0036312393